MHNAGMFTRALPVAGVVVFVSALVHSQAARTVQEGVFSDTQAARGQGLYAAQCASCHGGKLEGAQGPPLVGDGFVANWQSQSLSELAGKIRNTMPADAPGGLTQPQTTDILAHILKAGGFPAGQAELADAALARITWPQRRAAAQPAPAATAPAGGKAYPPLGNMAQLMRGVFFPNSNLIFTVQTRDPAEKAKPVDAGTQADGFSWATWGAGIYGGWELVDNAAVALADASPLMLTPGLKCENGRIAPVTEPAWIKFTEATIEISRRIYSASQQRNQERVSELTGDLSDACAACHQAYRDVRGRGQAFNPNDPSNKANRCMSRVTAK
jgi:mono/diheme cytochrome c family protein